MAGRPEKCFIGEVVMQVQNLRSKRLLQVPRTSGAAFLCAEASPKEYPANVTEPEQLAIFQPQNVYSPSGLREGMVSLREGIVDFERIVTCLTDDDVDCCASLEWFGKEPFQYLSGEMEWLRHVSTPSIPYEVRR